MNKLSANLKNLLFNAKISENELARKTGVAQQVINRILSGENKNPKIATLSPLANYFMVSISQLIGDDIFDAKPKLNTSHLGWQEIPIIDWDLLIKKSLNELVSQSNEKLLVDINPSKNIFALRMHDDSMEPKFSNGAILIFDPNKKPSNGDFSLLELPNHEIEVRQLFIKNNNLYKKCLNPLHQGYKSTPIGDDVKHLGLLIQSRTDHIIR